MKITKDNMTELAARLDKYSSTLEGISVDDVCTMAYQLQYFFEAKEKIKERLEENPILELLFVNVILNTAVIEHD